MFFTHVVLCGHNQISQVKRTFLQKSVIFGHLQFIFVLFKILCNNFVLFKILCNNFVLFKILCNNA